MLGIRKTPFVRLSRAAPPRKRGGAMASEAYFTAVVEIPDDPRTPPSRKEYWLDASTKRNYTDVTIYEWDEEERRDYSAAIKNR